MRRNPSPRYTADLRATGKQTAGSDIPANAVIQSSGQVSPERLLDPCVRGDDGYWCWVMGEAHVGVDWLYCTRKL